jgi:hypothetical protein
MSKMKTTSRAIAWITVVFFTGVMFGGALTFVIYQPYKPPWADHRKETRRSPDRLLGAITERLNLDERQQEQFRKVLLETRDRFRAVHQEIQEETRRRIETILSPDQLEQFDEFMAKAPRHHPLGRQRERKSP